MFKKWTIFEIICVIFLLVFVKKYTWSKIRNSINEVTLLKTNDNINEDFNGLNDEIVPNFISYQVAVVAKPTKKPLILCGGSLISKKYVLTAAHCLQGANHITIILNPRKIDYVEKTQFTIESRKFKIHPEWTPNMLLNDLALVKVKIPKHTETHLITLPAKGNIRKRIGTIHGWEKNKNKNNDSSLILRKYDVTIIENKICEEHFGSLIQKTNLCTKSDDFKNGCHSFSGSPLVVDDIQIGVLSFGTDICNIGYPTVYTRISEYTKWIEENSDVTVH